KFKDLCDELSESEDNLFAYEFCFEMAKHYNYESEHQTKANKMLSEYLKCSVQPIVTKGHCHTNGTVCYGDGPNVYCEVNVKYKRHNCSSDACPYLENCGHYLIFCMEKKEHSSYHETNFPCFLIVISDVAIVDLLTLVFPLIWQKYNEAMMVSIAKIFHEPQTIYPVHPLFPEVIIDDKSYMVHINSQVSTNLLWEVTLLNEQRPHLTVYVRAVQKYQYLLDTHKLLDEVEYAPKVFTTSVIPGNWILVYMESLNNHSILHNITSNLDNQKQSSLRKKIKEVVKYLNNSGYVHEDLCEENILVHQLEDNEFNVKLIDFE
ncbi:816_t:CDS:2, partial [Racocetra persica]